MNISGENHPKLANVHTVCIEITPADYTEQYDKEVKQAAQNLELPGFRKGHVPAGLIKKKFGHELLQGVVQRLNEESIRDYIEKEGFLTMGGIFPSEKQSSYEVLPNEPCTFFFNLLVVPPLELPSNLKITATRPIFDDAAWERFDRRMGHQLQHFEQDTPLGGNQYLIIELDIHPKREEGKEESEGDTNSEDWETEARFLLAWEELPEAIQAQLRGKKMNDRVVFNSDMFDTLAACAPLSTLKEDDYVCDSIAQNGFSLYIETVIGYYEREVTRELLEQYIIDRNVDFSQLSDEDLLKRIHEAEENRVLLACKLLSTYKALEQIAEEWQFGIPGSIVQMTLPELDPKLVAFYALLQRETMRSQAFMKRVIEATHYDEKEHEKETTLDQVVIAFDAYVSGSDLFPFTLFTPIQKCSYYLQKVHEKSDDDGDGEQIDQLLEAFAFIKALMSVAEFDYQDRRVQEVNWSKELRRASTRFIFKAAGVEDTDDKTMQPREKQSGSDSELINEEKNEK